MEKNNNPQNTECLTFVSKACAEVQGFDELYRRLERREAKAPKKIMLVT